MTCNNPYNINYPRPSKHVCLACNAYIHKYGKGNLIQAKMRFEQKYLQPLYVPNGQCQKSEAWLRARQDYFTASDIPTVLGNNMFKSVSDLLFEKYHPQHEQVKAQRRALDDNPAIQWGNRYEDDALKAYEYETGHYVVQTGLLCNKEKYPLVAGSPDGVTLCRRVVEIKCPYTRSIPKSGKGLTTVPRHYVDQIKTCMCVLQMKHCDFVQFRPRGFGLKGRVDKNRQKELLVIPYSFKTKKDMCQYMSLLESVIIKNKTIFATTIDTLGSDKCLYF